MNELEELLERGVGDNNPPRDTLREETETFWSRAAELSDAMGRIPDDADLGDIADLARMQDAYLKAVEAWRKGRKALPLEEGRAIDSYHHALADAVREDRAVLAMRLSGAMRPGAQVRGQYAVVSATQGWSATCDPATVDLETLRPFLDPAAVDHALRLFVKGGGRQLDGATIMPITMVIVR
ncbi:MAG: hypothetical protein ACREDY_13495 [Bradyrhizobium sp.]